MSTTEPGSTAEPHDDAAAQARAQAGDATTSQQAPPGSDATRDAEPRHKRPWGWIAIASLLAATTIGLGIWALGLNGDLDDAEATVAAQEQQIGDAKETGQGALDVAKQAFDDVTKQVQATEQQAADNEQAVEDAAAQLDQAEQKATEAEGTADEAKSQADAAQTKAETAATCAKSFVTAFGHVFDGPTLQDGVEAAKAELAALENTCSPALGAE